MSHSCEVCGDTQKQLKLKHISLLRHKTMKNHEYAYICTECFNLLNDKPSLNHYEHLGDENIEHCK